MQRFKKVLFVANGSSGQKTALARAVEIAEVEKARLTLIDVLDLEQELTAGQETQASLAEVHESILAERREQLEELKSDLAAKHPGLRMSVEVSAEKVATGIVRSVLKGGHDLVIKTPEGGQRGLTSLFGSTDLRLMRKCPCAVWIAKPSRRKRYRNIVAAVDLNPLEPQTMNLAKQVMTIATSFARLEKSRLHVVHAWRLAGEAKIRGRQITTYKVEKLLGEIRDAHQHELDALLREHPFEETAVHLVKGSAGDVIPDVVAKLDADLVVIGTVGRAGIPGLVIGNTAERVLNAVHCSVLTLKPEGFETPISV
jgi:universal stress protein E